MIYGVIILGFMQFVRWALGSCMNYFVAMLVSAVIGVVAYLCIIYFSKVFTKKEKKNLNFKRKSFIKQTK